MTSLPEVTSNGTTVWVNGPLAALGRFGPRGIDVHNAEGTGCLHCTHGATTLKDWDTFVEDMKQYHDVDVESAHIPEFIARELYSAKVNGTHD